jgi:hypothetical protein
MKKIPQKYASLLFAACFSFIMVGVITCTLTAVAGSGADFLFRWLRAWGIGWMVGIPTAYFLAPRVRGFLNRLVEP